MKYCKYINLLVVLVAILAAVYIDHNYLLPPCASCQLQRLTLYILALTIVVRLLVPRLTFYISYSFISLVGLLLALNHLRLYYFTTTISFECGHKPLELTNISYLISVLTEPSSCIFNGFRIMGATLAHWSALVFFVVFLLSILDICLLRAKREGEP